MEHQWFALSLFMLATCYGVSIAEENIDDTVFKYHSFQVEARAGKMDCFYQLLNDNTSLTLIWHVMSSGGGGQLAVTVTLKREADMRILYDSPYGQMGDHREENLERGTYEICINNELSYTSKSVYLWIDYQMKKSWEGAVSNDSAIEHYQLKRDLVRDILRTLEARLQDMSYYQTLYRQNTFFDEALLMKLYETVNQRSVIASSAIVLSAFIQVYFVRKLFSLPPKTTNSGI